MIVATIMDDLKPKKVNYLMILTYQMKGEDIQLKLNSTELVAVFDVK